MLVAQVVKTPSGTQLRPIDTLRESVRLAAGLTDNKLLGNDAYQRGLTAIRRFGERIRGFDPSKVRAVATNTLRVAKNAPSFIRDAEEALGFPIEVIAGVEEARLIYIGAAHEVSAVQGNRLVVDIGGGSTEFIIGKGYEPKLMESLYIGCVSHSLRFFPKGNIDAHAFKEAELAARREIQVISGAYLKSGWKQVIGSSGTARALADLIAENNFNGHQSEGLTMGRVNGASGLITRDGLRSMKKHLLKYDNISQVVLQGLKDDRRSVWPGGLAIMIAVFDELGIESMEVTDAALRVGVLYDLLGRSQHDDMRFVTVEQFMQRYAVDREQAKRVGIHAAEFLSQLPKPDSEDREDNIALLQWAANLHEIGLSIAHNGYHKHSAYIAGNADMPGFSKNDQARLAALLIGHAGKLGKLANNPSFRDWRMLFCLRLSQVLCRGRSDIQLPKVKVSEVDGSYLVSLSKDWVDAHPLTEFSLLKEAAEWERIGRPYKVILR
ncbi:MULTISPECIES: Ppx/GppA phosphatase family protein [unclassified Polynucleobacter]|uniref:Ppx/GppA phosphatase family protein n=1 Tax=unclassified Polynucleobacter TaxID=2640945 RepID=UPI0008C627D0|nr:MULTISPECIES: Ppx/GppA phosphatase family protein [unclassified Polynucleobacter]OHC10264.1 MAG: exopolyphosphatase [Polynucleobacter sp. GWA2_45_21]HBK43712.1 exopolyphosphatase [Polynucleobacter sp.]